MSVIATKQPILDDGIRLTNFFNGRLLTGADLRREQDAHRQAHRRLGQAIGEGIARGLEVSKSATATATNPKVTVAAGLALNRIGQTLALSQVVELALTQQYNQDAGAQTFSECLPLQGGAYVAGAGAYLLTIAPASSNEGRAMMSGLGNVTASCNTDAIVETAQFRLLPLSPPLTQTDLQDQQRLRNRLAYKCFGVDDFGTFYGNPFAPQSPYYGLLDELRPNTLTDCDVPLAVLYWTLTDGVRFVDMWAARRRMTAGTLDYRWQLLLSDRRVSEAEAMFQQFEEQIRDIRASESNLENIKASGRFDYLPPAGVLPLAEGGNLGFDFQKFFEDQAFHPPVFIEEAMVEPLIRAGLTCAPISLLNKDPIRLYRVAGGNIIRPYLIFTSAYAPFLGEARYDTARWDYSNFV
jgi:hypothetical protein